MSRSHAYYNDNGLKIHRDDADGKMIFLQMRDMESLDRNSRSEKCFFMDADDVMNLPNDMIFVVFNRQENVVLFLEKWKLCYIDLVNIVNSGKRSAGIMVPYKMFKSIGGFTWIDDNASNVTWDSVKDFISPETMPKDISDQLPHFQNAIKEARKGI